MTLAYFSSAANGFQLLEAVQVSASTRLDSLLNAEKLTTFVAQSTASFLDSAFDPRRKRLP